MKTFTQMKKDAAGFCGLYVDAPEMGKVSEDMQTGIKLFQNAARRYWTRIERKTNLAASQQYYQFPSDATRVSSVKAKVSDRYVPLTQIHSEDEWNELSLGNLLTSNAPAYYFIKGADEVGLYPIPSAAVTDGLMVVFEPRMVDMMIEDTTPTVSVTENSNVVTAVGATTFSPNIINNCWFKTTDGSDGNWYKITKYIDSTHAWIDNNFQGPTSASVTALIGQVAQFPEEYHDAPVHYAAQQFFTLRKDLESASFHGQQFDKLFNEYRTTYGNKTTGGVINPRGRQHIPVANSWPGILRG